MSRMKRRNRLVDLATAYTDQGEAASEEFVIPEDFSTLSDEELKALSESAVEHFDSMYGDGSSLSDETLVALQALTEGIEALATEQNVRDEAAQARAEAAAALANRVRPDAEDAEAVEEEEEEASTDGEEPAVDAEVVEEETSDEGAAETVVASSRTRTAIRVPVSRKNPAPAPVKEKSIKDVLTASGEGLGVPVHSGLDWDTAGKALSKRLQSFNLTAYQNASNRGQHIREQGALFSIARDIPDELVIQNSDQGHIDEVFNRATDESRLPQGSLVASGGWCAPSETLYDLIELETRAGLLSLPEVGVARGGINFTKGPTFQDIYADIPGFHFTEEDDEAGRYALDESGDATVGEKPCYKVDCPEFEEHRLDVQGICITAGLLASRGYPEYLARVVRGALVAHDHRLNGRMISEMESGSTAITMPSTQAGAAAPILTSIELQVEHYRYTHRLSDTATLEAVFPFWVRGVIRADLARRQGLDVLNVTNAQINAWFASRGVAPQYVYNWQTIDGTAAADFTQWPNELTFLLYTAGTWIRGASDLITLDTLYDSTLTQTNDYVALFTEEGYMVVKRGLDSRAVSLTFSADGATHQGIDIEHDGTAAVVGG